jgi:hypothetical protein
VDVIIITIVIISNEGLTLKVIYLLTYDGALEGSSDGSLEGPLDGLPEGVFDGFPEGNFYGRP